MCAKGTNDMETTDKIYKLARFIRSKFVDNEVSRIIIDPEDYFEYSEIFLNKNLLRRLNTLTRIHSITVKWEHKLFNKMDYKVVATLGDKKGQT